MMLKHVLPNPCSILLTIVIRYSISHIPFISEILKIVLEIYSSPKLTQNKYIRPNFMHYSPLMDYSPLVIGDFGRRPKKNRVFLDVFYHFFNVFNRFLSIVGVLKRTKLSVTRYKNQWWSRLILMNSHGTCWMYCNLLYSISNSNWVSYLLLRLACSDSNSIGRDFVTLT